MIGSMLKNRIDYIIGLGRPITIEEKRVINWAFQNMSKEKAIEYLDNKFAEKKEKEEKIVKVKNKEEVI
jgi:hypothetical protein